MLGCSSALDKIVRWSVGRQGRIQSGARGGHASNRRFSGFFTGKTGFVGTVLFTRSVLWT